MGADPQHLVAALAIEQRAPSRSSTERRRNESRVARAPRARAAEPWRSGRRGPARHRSALRCQSRNPDAGSPFLPLGLLGPECSPGTQRARIGSGSPSVERRPLRRARTVEESRPPENATPHGGRRERGCRSICSSASRGVVVRRRRRRPRVRRCPRGIPRRSRSGSSRRETLQLTGGIVDGSGGRPSETARPEGRGSCNSDSKISRGTSPVTMSSSSTSRAPCT